ncbi:MAG: ndx1 [Bacteroidetes bacterium]|nr:ndx1 [Bacteroidota bacterium]
MIKIFSAGKIVRLVNSHHLFDPQPGSILLTVSSATEMSDFYHELISSKDINEICFCNSNELFLFDSFSSMFKLIEAAGGLVKNNKGDYLFIFRKGKWDLPKGKIEKDEAIRTAAVREVEEECGISDLTIIKEIDTTYHTYFIKEQAVLKPTYWFEMTSSDASVLKPQLEEGITEVRWIAPKDFNMVRDNSYESIMDVIAEL